MDEKPTPSDRETTRTGTAAAEGGVRRAGLRALAATLPKVTRRALGRRGFAEAGLIADWPSIVGEAVAARCAPKKLDRPRPGRQGEGTLTLRVEAGFALELQHLAPLLIERVNGYFGYRAVSRLKLFQAQALGPGAPARRPPRPLSAEEENALRRRTGAVEDEDLRQALERLGRAMLQRGT
ncbi:MAG: DUF721 domain-containing protein [Kiloniellaceae bacterium]